MIFGWEGRSKGEFSGGEVLTIFTGVWGRWCGTRLSKRSKRYTEDLCVSFCVNVSYHQSLGSETNPQGKYLGW